MPRRKKTCDEFVELWTKDYPELQARDTKLYCTKCNVSFPQRKASMERHFNSEKHTSVKKDFRMELTKFMVSCNIPWSQLENPIFKKFINNCVSGKFEKTVEVPSECLLRQNYVNQIYDEQMQKIKKELENSFIYVSVDETTDARGRQIANVIVGALLEDAVGTPHVLSSKKLEQTNNISITDTVKNALDNLWGLDHNKHEKVLLLLTDGVGYMQKAGRTLKKIYPDLLHVTCLAHGLNRVADQVRVLFPEVNKLISNVKKVFRKSPKRIKAFKEMVNGIPLPPNPTIIRWGTWIEAATYYNKYFEEIKGVVDTFRDSDAACITKAKKAFRSAKIRNDLNFIAKYLQVLPDAINKLQCPNLSLSESLAIVQKTYKHISKLNLSANGKNIFKKLKMSWR